MEIEIDPKRCPVWGTSADTHYLPLKKAAFSRSDSMGGRYCISHAALEEIKTKDHLFKARLTTWAIEQRRSGIVEPEINLAVLEQVNSRKRLLVELRLDNLIDYLDKKSDFVGKNIIYRNHHDEVYACTESSNHTELEFILEYAKIREFINWDPFFGGGGAVMLMPAGFARLDELGAAKINSSQAFVAMWFDASLNDAYAAGIKPGIEDAGYTAVRVDAVDHNNKIDDTIIAEIRRSRFLVADFTHGEKGHRGGVYYEAGFAHGLNIPVIFTCREDIIGEIHFDTRQYNHITWKEPAELREKLSKRISATIWDGPNRKAP